MNKRIITVVIMALMIGRMAFAEDTIRVPESGVYKVEDGDHVVYQSRTEEWSPANKYMKIAFDRNACVFRMAFDDNGDGTIDNFETHTFPRGFVQNIDGGPCYIVPLEGGSFMFFYDIEKEKYSFILVREDHSWSKTYFYLDRLL